MALDADFVTLVGIYIQGFDDGSHPGRGYRRTVCQQQRRSCLHCTGTGRWSEQRDVQLPGGCEKQASPTRPTCDARGAGRTDEKASAPAGRPSSRRTIRRRVGTRCSRSLASVDVMATRLEFPPSAGTYRTLVVPVLEPGQIFRDSNLANLTAALRAQLLNDVAVYFSENSFNQLTVEFQVFGHDVAPRAEPLRLPRAIREYWNPAFEPGGLDAVEAGLGATASISLDGTESLKLQVSPRLRPQTELNVLFSALSAESLHGAFPVTFAFAPSDELRLQVTDSAGTARELVVRSFTTTPFIVQESSVEADLAAIAESSEHSHPGSHSRAWTARDGSRATPAGSAPAHSCRIRAGHARARLLRASRLRQRDGEDRGRLGDRPCQPGAQCCCPVGVHFVLVRGSRAATELYSSAAASGSGEPRIHCWQPAAVRTDGHVLRWQVDAPVPHVGFGWGRGILARGRVTDAPRKARLRLPDRCRWCGHRGRQLRPARCRRHPRRRAESRQ